METILWIFFSILNSIGFFVLFHTNFDTSFGRKKGVEFNFDDLFGTALKAAGAILLGTLFGVLMVAIWPFFLVIFGIVVLGFLVALTLKKLFS